jgi:outer membrane protein TolC
VTDPITGISTTTNTLLQQSGYFDALRNITGFDAPTWTLGLTFAYPIGQSTQEATVARSKLSLEQTKVNLKALELQIATDVTDAALNVQATLESVQSTVAARELALKKLEAAQSKMEVGMATNYEVVQAQRDYTDARNAELRSVLNYRKALVNFETVQHVGTRAVSAVGGGANGAGLAVGGGGQ